MKSESKGTRQLTDLPADIIAAAETLTNYFESRGTKFWALKGVASRDLVRVTPKMQHYQTAINAVWSAYGTGETCLSEAMKLVAQLATKE
jgi:hypothetical protein